MLKTVKRLSPTTLCILVVYLTTFIFVMPLVGRDLVYSVYRSASWNKSTMKTRAMKENDMEFEAAKDYINTRHSQVFGHIIKEKPLNGEFNTIIVVVTVPRSIGSQPLGYLTRTVASLDRLIRADISEHSLVVCNVNSGPGPHRELETLRHLFAVVDRFPNGSATATIMDPFEKEKEDYVFCMTQALAGQAKTIIMVEDDAVARDDLFPVIRWTLSLERTSKNARRSWAYVKLFYPERWQGYALDVRSILELASIFSVGGSVGVRLQAVCSRRPQRVSRKQFAVFGLYFVLIVLSIGRQHLLAMKRLAVSTHSLTTAPACCSPAILYLANFALKLTRHLSSNVRCSAMLPLDMAIDRFADAAHQPKYLVEPNLFRHIGLISTMKGYSEYPEDFLI